jgi:predicted signal transduction protein with EAL and GGDEF domain
MGEAVRLLPRIALLRGQPGDSGSSLLDRLDQALVQLQRGAARRLLWADGSHRARARSAALLEADLIGALHRDEIAILYQPQFRVSDGALAGAEALARWEHPTIGRSARPRCSPWPSGPTRWPRSRSISPGPP